MTPYARGVTIDALLLVTVPLVCAVLTVLTMIAAA
jgi:hypothetical protein